MLSRCVPGSWNTSSRASLPAAMLALCSERPALGLLLCCSYLEILNTFWINPPPYFYFPWKLYCQAYSRHSINNSSLSQVESLFKSSLKTEGSAPPRRTLFINNKDVFVYSWPHHTACGVLVPWPGIESVLPTVEVWSLNHRTHREVPTKKDF